MRIQLDNTTYHINLEKVSLHLQAWYRDNRHYGDKVEVDGKTIDFSRKSVARIALKTALVPIAIPALRMLYKIKGAELPSHEKHEDLIDYCVERMLGIIGLFEKDSIYVESIETTECDVRLIDAISTSLPKRIARTGVEKEAKESSSRGEALLRGGEDGNGQDETY